MNFPTITKSVRSALIIDIFWKYFLSLTKFDFNAYTKLPFYIILVSSDGGAMRFFATKPI